jgi:hypothetical protein
MIRATVPGCPVCCRRWRAASAVAATSARRGVLASSAGSTRALSWVPGATPVRLRSSGRDLVGPVRPAPSARPLAPPHLPYAVLQPPVRTVHDPLQRDLTGPPMRRQRPAPWPHESSRRMTRPRGTPLRGSSSEDWAFPYQGL